ncbi:Hypothetical predicted protein [Pelobates cultripes]|uniref:Uncharacterized protein n=1 Tax=Pelobates cultripes TaxID=61616 RepID=A0AAD1SEG1_PELCU|nr:Hypothetical predicted protein [Pelobates cultripes]
MAEAYLSLVGEVAIHRGVCGGGAYTWEAELPFMGRDFYVEAGHATKIASVYPIPPCVTLLGLCPAPSPFPPHPSLCYSHLGLCPAPSLFAPIPPCVTLWVSALLPVCLPHPSLCYSLLGLCPAPSLFAPSLPVLLSPGSVPCYKYVSPHPSLCYSLGLCPAPSLFAPSLPVLLSPGSVLCYQSVCPIPPCVTLSWVCALLPVCLPHSSQCYSLLGLCPAPSLFSPNSSLCYSHLGLCPAPSLFAPSLPVLLSPGSLPCSQPVCPIPPCVTLLGLCPAPSLFAPIPPCVTLLGLCPAPSLFAPIPPCVSLPLSPGSVPCSQSVCPHPSLCKSPTLSWVCALLPVPPSSLAEPGTLCLLLPRPSVSLEGFTPIIGNLSNKNTKRGSCNIWTPHLDTHPLSTLPGVKAHP